MTTYKVTEVVNSRPWPAEGQAKVIYFDFKAEGVDKVCNIGRKPGNELKVGDTIEANAEEDRGKLKLKVIQAGGFGGGGPRPEDPKRSARILRQHSQQMAIEWVAFAHARGTLPEDFKLGGLKPIIDWFDKDANEAAKK